ncbi:MAG: efflux RND transporter permease subunit [Bacteroidales bacterium]|nr:efflux RND transporter permease subunit [Bacteroidales bacterium]
MSIYGNAVKKPITTAMIFLAIIVFGVFSLTRLPIDLMPEIEIPAITVFTTYGGASAQDIETNISEVLEESLNRVDDLKEINSVSRDNFSVITLEFEFGTNLDAASNDIRDILSLIKDKLPEEAEEPTLFKFDMSMMPVIAFAFTADESYEGIEKLLDNKISNPLKMIEGVGTIGIMGTPKREISINVDPIRLEAYNLSVELLGQILQAENLNMPTGSVDMGRMSYQLRVQGEFERSDQIKNIVIGSQSGKNIYLKDVATVRDSIKEMTIDQRANGMQSVTMMIMKQSGANTVRIADEVNKKMTELEKTLPEDINVVPIYDSSEFIKDSLNNLTSTLMYAMFFVVVVVLFFLGRWRATFIIVLTIPIALIVSFIYLYGSGNTINIISLSALSIAIGMVVDDAIVVLENITKHIERGASPREAAIYATNEVWLAVIVTTLTIVAVFFPMTMVGGMAGILFKPLGWIVTITVVTSTIAAITLTPMLSSKLLKLKQNKKKPGKYSWDRIILPKLDKLDAFYERTLKWSLKNKKIIVVGSLIILFSSFFLAKHIGTEFMPVQDDGILKLEVELQSGTRVEESSRVAREIESLINAKVPEVKLISTSAGTDEDAGITAIFRSTGSNIITSTVILPDARERDRSFSEIANVIRDEIATVPEVINFKVSLGNSMGSEGANNVDVIIYGYDIDNTTKLANVISERLEKIEGAKDIKISREKSKPELRVLLDQDKMSQNGLNTYTVSTALRNRVAGLTASKFREEGEEYDIVVQYNKDSRNSISDIENIAIQNPMGEYIRLSEIGQVVEYWSPPNIERKRRERIVTVSTTPYGISLGEMANIIKDDLELIDIPDGVIVEVGGAYEDQQESFADLGLLLVVSLILVYIVMASQFESLKMPLIIMFSIPFAFVGVIIALYITDTVLSIVAALGAIMLIGIVVKNAIVLVDYINLMRDRGHSLDEAITLSGKSRLRPVLMTAMTTILGMLPLALSRGDGSEMWSPMGIAIIGGLIFSTIITMILVPVAYRLFAVSGTRKKEQRLARAQYKFMDM